jgi:hypothetical protein
MDPGVRSALYTLKRGSEREKEKGKRLEARG